MTKIVDCFPYFNEVELLELRIRMLYDHVDGFIITDADHTHSGMPKPFTCKQTLRNLGVPTDKIEVIEVNLPSKSLHDLNWTRERLQRNWAASRFEDDTVYLVSDCDEIIDPNAVQAYRDAYPLLSQNILRIPMVWLNARADYAVCDPNGNLRMFNTPFACSKSQTIKYSLSDIREAYAMWGKEIDYKDIFPLDNNGQIKPAGWHFSWMGDPDRLKTKLVSYLHSDDNDPLFDTAAGPMGSDRLIQFVEQFRPQEGSTDVLGRPEFVLKKYPLESLPKEIFQLPHIEDFLFR